MNMCIKFTKTGDFGVYNYEVESTRPDVFLMEKRIEERPCKRSCKCPLTVCSAYCINPNGIFLVYLS